MHLKRLCRSIAVAGPLLGEVVGTARSPTFSSPILQRKKPDKNKNIPPTDLETNNNTSHPCTIHPTSAHGPFNRCSQGRRKGKEVKQFIEAKEIGGETTENTRIRTSTPTAKKKYKPTPTN
jgi:hypothetical protein